MKKILFLLLWFPILVVAQTQTENYIKNTTYKQATTTSIATPTPTQANQNITYFDGLGRPIQQIAHQQSGSGKDIVTPIEYDAFGRQEKDYLPYVPNTPASLNYKISAFTEVGTFYNTPAYENTTNPYSQKLFEASPLNRVMKQAAPGTDWKMPVIPTDPDHTIKLDYQTNTETEVKLFTVTTTWNASTGLYDSVLSQSVNYGANQLYKKVTKDENWTSGNNNTNEEFKNKEGQVILKRTYDAAVEHDTYYVYDVYGNLTYVIPPVVTNALDQTQKDGLCYQYKYDYRNRLVEKKLPGKQWEFIVYDKLDRVVATGPAFSPFSDQVGTIGWLITKYDVFNRPVYTGWQAATVTTTSRKSLQDAQNNATVLNETKTASGSLDNISAFYTNVVQPTTFKLLTVNYYDNYAFPTVATIPSSVEGQNVLTTTKSLATGSWVRALTTSTATTGETATTIYDEKARPIRSYLTNYLGGYTYTDTNLDFAGVPQYTKTYHKRLATDTELKVTEVFTYSPQGRLLTHTHQINTNPVQLLASNTYDELGQLTSKNVGNTTIQPLQKVDYVYNIRGWMTGINNDPTNNLIRNTTENDLFAFKINYNTIAGTVTGVKALYNGNIAETYWRTASDNALRKYGYEYDNLNRLKNATYQKPENVNPVTNMYNESLNYDKNGNILSLLRNGNSDAVLGTIEIDNLNYGYQINSNKLASVLDSSNNISGFKDGNTSGDDYEYDLNGNMTADKNKGITNIIYNHLNLPILVEFNNSSTKKISYLYNANGVKLRKWVWNSNYIPIRTEYLDGFQYIDESLQFFPTAEGYVKNTAGVYAYVYNYTDHLGNVRMSYQDIDKNGSISSNEMLEESNYYPFGLKHSPSAVVNAQPNYKYKYNGKELQDELGLNMYDYGWRNYMPDIGRWSQSDPLLNDLKFANDVNDVDPDDHEAVYMAIIDNSEVGGGIYNTDNLNPYGYGYNNPVSFDDPDGRCPSCIWGAIIGAGVDYGLQVAVNYADGKSGSEAWTDVSLTSIAVSAGAGALSGGISSLKQVKNAGTIAKIGIGALTDTGISVSSQAIKKGKVSLRDTAIDVAAGGIATGVGGIVEKKVLNSSTGKKLAAAVNAEKNIARGKSNIVPKNKADVKGAIKKLETYAGIRATASGAVASGAASTTYTKIEEKKKKK